MNPMFLNAVAEPANVLANCSACCSYCSPNTMPAPSIPDARPLLKAALNASERAANCSPADLINAPAAISA